MRRTDRCAYYTVNIDDMKTMLSLWSSITLNRARRMFRYSMMARWYFSTMYHQDYSTEIHSRRISSRYSGI
jgi:hypothetical protein